MATAFQTLVWEHFDVETNVTHTTISTNHCRWEGKKKPQNQRSNDEYSEIVNGRLQHIWIFGKTLQGESIAAKVPCVSYMYVDAPKWALNSNEKIGEALYKCVHNTYPGSLLSCEYVKRKKFFGYHGDMEFGFYKVSFVSSEALRMCANVLRKRPITFDGLSHQFTVYESNVDPIIRFMHDNGFESTGWVTLDEKEVPKTVGKETTCKWEYHCRGVHPLSPMQSNQKAPFVQVRILSFECMDRHVQPRGPPSHGGTSPLMSLLDSPNGCFLRWSVTAALLLVIIIFVGLVRSQMRRISDRGGVRLTDSESVSRNFLLVLLIFLISLEVLSIYKMIDCYL
jgi:hypothetical protein